MYAIIHLQHWGQVLCPVSQLPQVDVSLLKSLDIFLFSLQSVVELQTHRDTSSQVLTEDERRQKTVLILSVCWFVISKDAPLFLLFYLDRVINDESPCSAQITAPHFLYLSYIQTKNYQMVDFHRISQCPALALGDIPPQSSILCRRVPCLWRRANQAVLWRHVPLRGERRNDTSLKRHQFCWRQAAFQCGGRICQRGDT